jgi:hypothetical protein
MGILSRAAGVGLAPRGYQPYLTRPRSQFCFKSQGPGPFSLIEPT